MGVVVLSAGVVGLVVIFVVRGVARKDRGSTADHSAGATPILIAATTPDGHAFDHRADAAEHHNGGTPDGGDSGASEGGAGADNGGSGVD